MNISRSNFLNQFALYFPYIVIFLMFIGLLFGVLIDRIDYAIRGLAIAIPGFMAAFFLLLFKRDYVTDEKPIVLFLLKNKFLLICFIFTYALSIISLYISPYRTMYYFILLSLLYCFIGIQIMSQNLREFVISENRQLLDIGKFPGDDIETLIEHVRSVIKNGLEDSK